MSDQTKRAGIIAKIQALLAKTADNGCTEAEAMLATQKASELMNAYRISMTDIEIRDEPVTQSDIESPNKSRRAPADWCIMSIAAFTGTKTWYRSNRYTHRCVTFFGLEADVAFASYLYKMVNGAVASATDAYKQTDDYRADWNKRAATQSFQLGMARRINTRLHELSRQAQPIKTASGTALVVVKNAIVEQAFANTGMRLRTVSQASVSVRRGNAYRAGQSAGNDVRFDRPLGNGRATAAIR